MNKRKRALFITKKFAVVFVVAVFVIGISAMLFHFSLPIANAAECGGSSEPTFTVELPNIDNPNAVETIEIPNGRSIYALMVHGYAQNEDLDQLLTYKFSKYLMEKGDYVMEKGAYIHYAWWNNLCAEYMARPLHNEDSHPGRFNIVALLDPDLGDKAIPEDDYQFQADAERFLQAIRENNPNAIIILVGHSMGGAAVARLGTNTDVVIDILAPIDPVDNRSKPEGRIPMLPAVLYWYPRPPTVFRDYNYTRWRIAHNEFRGYKRHVCRWNGILCVECIGSGDEWHGFYDLPLVPSDGICGLTWYPDYPLLSPWYNPFVDDPLPRVFESNVINLFHRYQMEYFFPFDYDSEEHFIHNPPIPMPENIIPQASVATRTLGQNNILGEPGLPYDGHGEIVGFYGIVPEPIGLQAQDWPEGHFYGDNPREDLLEEMAERGLPWPHTPSFPQLCMVSDGLIDLYESMNKPPDADAGEDQLIECSGFGSVEVTLDGSASSDPDTDVLSYTWQGPFGEISGETVTVTLGPGTHEITLTVEDPSGHIDCDILEVTIAPCVVTVRPSSATLPLGNTQLFTATSSGCCENTPCYAWSIHNSSINDPVNTCRGGGIDANGHYTTATCGAEETVIAIDTCNDNVTGTASVTVVNAQCFMNTHCDDGRFCNGTESCVGGRCRLGTPPCAPEMCDEENDVCTVPGPGPICEEDADCDDTLFCNGIESCDEEGECVSPGNPCSAPTPVCNEEEDSCEEGELPLPCEIIIEPESPEVASGGTLSFTVTQEGDCVVPTYEWSIESTIRSSVDQNGTYKAGCTLFNAATDVVSVVDSGNENTTAEATITVSPKCTLVKIYGENSKEVKILRLFRDNVLSKTPEGQEIIMLYNQWSPAIVKAMERDEEFKEEVKEMIDGILGLIPEKAE